MFTIRHDWNLQEVLGLLQQPFNDLLFQAQSVHRTHFDPNQVQVSTLLSIKTGACPEDCKYCPQSGHYNTGLEKEKLIELEQALGRPVKPNSRVPPAFVWVRRGNTQRPKTCHILSSWCAR